MKNIKKIIGVTFLILLIGGWFSLVFWLFGLTGIYYILGFVSGIFISTMLVLLISWLIFS